MKRILSVLLVLCMTLVLGITAFADVMPPVFYSVTVGEKPIRRYTIKYKDDSPDYLMEDGVFRSGDRIDVTEVVVINGQKYGEYTSYNDDDEPITNEYGVRMNIWKSYYFLLDDVIDPADASAKRLPSPSREMELNVISQPETTTATTTRPQPETTTATTTQPDTTTETVTQTEPESETTTAAQTDTSETATQTQQTQARESAAIPASDGAQNRSPMRTVLACVGAALLLVLTVTVTLVLIRRKQINHTGKEEDQ